jgi:hypothetical protein
LSAVSSKSNTSMFSAMRLGFGGLGNDRAVVLQTPAQHYLGRGLAVLGGEVFDDRVIEGAAVVAVAVERDAADW